MKVSGCKPAESRCKLYVLLILRGLALPKLTFLATSDPLNNTWTRCFQAVRPFPAHSPRQPRRIVDLDLVMCPVLCAQRTRRLIMLAYLCT
ncbi:hypothetical protein K474DRAFT_1494795 [Panus rudis PR-1116 ss-1]|nr:hypothetical protein K474DRAFT_1494795 [Panus rudis PR-1116 ss-1]